MIAFIILFALLFLFLLERASRRDDLRHVHIVCDADMKLVEPGEVITLRYTLYNTSPWPLLSVGFSLQLDDAFQVCEEESWLKSHVTQDFSGLRVDHRLYLLPRQKFSGRLHVAIKRRGVFDLGRSYLEVGDLFGLRPQVYTSELPIRLVCTAKRCEELELKTLGGFLGDVSVRRFIHEDPSMLIGYHEYTGREPMKQISWPQTAKTGRLIVKQHDFTVDRNVAVIVNMEATHRHYMERCLELTRGVCEQLEAKKIPYALFSNGDLFNLGEGLGKSHIFFILRRIGLSRLAGYTSFCDLVERCIRQRRGNCSYIIITPALNAAGEAAVQKLQNYTDQELCVLGPGGVKSEHEKNSSQPDRR